MSITEAQAQRMTMDELLKHRARYSFHKPTVDIIDREIARRRNANQTVQTQTLQNNIDTLNRRVQSLTSTNTQLQNAINNANTQLQQMNTRHQTLIRQMQRDFTQRLADTDRENLRRLQDMENRHERNQVQLREQFTTALRRNEENTRNLVQTTAQALNDRMEEIQTQTNGRIDEVQTQVANVRSMVEAMGADDAQRRAQAREIYQTALAVREETDAYNRANGHEWESVRRTEVVGAEETTRLNLDDAAQGAGLAARNLALTQLQHALIFREQVFAREREWQTAHALTEAAVVEAQTLLSHSRSVSFGDEAVDVDHWTCGELSRIRSRIEALDERLKDPSVDAEQMADMRDLAMRYRNEIEEAVTFALQARQMSYARQDMLQIAVEHLEETENMHFVWSEFYGGDERLGRRSYVRSDSGLEIVLTAEPVPQPDGTIINQLRSDIIRYPAGLMNQARINTLQRNIMNELEVDAGITTDGNEPTCSNGQIDRTQINADRSYYRDAERRMVEQRLREQATPIQREPAAPTPRAMPN